ncbi:FAD-dependent oxidoreductase [Sutcliffiella rhizosphaerae]|uniref:Cytochrome b6-f complex iron-sulfur subunit n=1 Tax=Sutcliffiella rhizosphaerae TaxID=2880967 RepID=A0ABN8AII4_9BACI|nr:FAD-dependent oxidoreductase [Sutcliffiella rhizosphaerae]CAG9622953.1 Cytochrome b6-f complex iron-sulfur subunit [Sutcliffiella rhizosphaerae]
MSTNQFHKLPKGLESYWRTSTTLSSFPTLKEDKRADVCVVGGGITGITTAYQLVQEGLKVILIDADQILNGTTGHTTAKVTAQHGLIYDEMMQHFGQEKAKLFYQANQDALHYIKDMVVKKRIDCDYHEQDAIIYSQSEDDDLKVLKEYEAYETLGINGELVYDIPLSLPVKSVAVMKNQAQFHPLQYLQALVDEMVQNGTEIYEHTVATDVEESQGLSVVTKNGSKVSCDYIVAASHFPFYDGQGFFFTRMYAERSYILAVKTEKTPPEGMYYSAGQPTRSLRYVTINGEKVALIGGEGHKTGQGKDTLKHYEALRTFGDEVLGVKEILYRWSAQDLYTLDKIPYIGRINSGHPNIFIATGFRKWGMTSGTAAALLIQDIIMKRENKYEQLFSPSRFVADPSLKKFISTNMDVASHLINGKFEHPTKTPDELGMDEGGVVNLNGRRAGAYKDENGELFCVDTTCTHLGCEVEWNHGDRSWDCPCHGSRFSIHGDVLEGPADKPLEKL